MKAQIKLGRIFGVEIGLHYSWFIIAFLITLSLAAQFRLNNPDWSDNLRWGLALITAVLFFAAIVVHELSHAVVAKSRGLPVRSITLFALGGVAQIEKEAADAKTEFWMGIIGPITSFVIGAVCLGVTLALGWTPPDFPQRPRPAMLMWLGYINIALAVFNMIPGFPLDGGRVLRAIAWWITGECKAGHHNRNPCRPDHSLCNDHSNVQTFADEHLVRTGRRFFVATLNGQPEGIITANEIAAIPRARWPYTTVADVMRPLDQARTVAPNTPITEALELMASQDLNQLPVIDEGRLAGLIARAHVLQLRQTRAELHV